MHKNKNGWSTGLLLIQREIRANTETVGLWQHFISTWKKRKPKNIKSWEKIKKDMELVSVQSWALEKADHCSPQSHQHSITAQCTPSRKTNFVQIMNNTNHSCTYRDKISDNVHIHKICVAGRERQQCIKSYSNDKNKSNLIQSEYE